MGLIVIMETSVLFLIGSGIFWAAFLVINDEKLFEFKWAFFFAGLVCLTLAFDSATITTGYSTYTAINTTIITNYTIQSNSNAVAVGGAFGLIDLGFFILWLYKAFVGLTDKAIGGKK